jgi:ABC-type transport system involved in cytochrome bd biosynthesis fused ATPase/permease subunit
MNKTYLTIGAVAIAALVGFGILTAEQGEKADNVLANLSDSTETFVSDVANATEEGLASDAQDAANEAMEATADAAQDAMQSAEEAIEPAAGEAEAEMDKMMQDVQN